MCILSFVKLVIVESPTKAKTLSALLDNKYTIKASMGHIRDLPKSGLGVDVDHDFAPEYVVAPKNKKVLTDLKKSLDKAESVVLATDPDREGEAIAWHLKELLSEKKGKTKIDFQRVVFHELTKKAISEAFSQPADLNMHLVDAQQARRVLDRLVGYKLSPLLWKKVRYGLSAGRVQSVAVRLIVERERERGAFVPVEYWDIDGRFETQDQQTFTAELDKKDGRKIEVSHEQQAQDIKTDLDGANCRIGEVKKSQRKRNCYPPYKTSTLQQAAVNVYGLSASKTMSAAQRLFEKGMITYHRTDSLNISESFLHNLRSYIENSFGTNYLPKDIVRYKTSSKSAQEAHEAIRPTDLHLKPADLTNSEEKKIYSLIYKRTLESQMNPAVYDQTQVKIITDKGYEFKASGSVIKFDGWLKVGESLGYKDDENGQGLLPELKEGESLKLAELLLAQKFTQPPGRYTDATLIKKLEDLGIGRPSTYAPTISTIIARKYVTRENRSFIPEDVAYVVNDLLVEHFPDVVDYQFTADMEEDLDEIAENKKEWVPVIREFYLPFAQKLLVKDQELQKRDVTNLGESEESCPDCGQKLIFKLGKYGKFLSCSNYPECTFAKPVEEPTALDENGVQITDFGKCPNCEDGKLILKKGRFGKFLACNNYPKCKTTKPFLEKIGLSCPLCHEGDVVVKKAKKKTFYGCSRYPDCTWSSWTKPPKETS